MKMGRLLARRVNYSEIARKMFIVEPMPNPVRHPPASGDPE